MSDLLKRIAALSPEQRAYFEARLKDKSLEGLIDTQNIVNNPFARIGKAPEKEYYPLSSSQKRMYILNQIEDNKISYNLSGALLVEGTLDRERLEWAFKKLIARHESFRTSFTQLGGEPVQQIHPEADFRIICFEAEESEAQEIILGFIQPFDLSKAPLLRVGLIRISPVKHILIYDMAHVISDGTSMGILEKELLALYDGEELPDLRIQYKDFAEWHNLFLQSEVIREQEKYWVERFKGELLVLNLPLDYPRPMRMSFKGDSYEFEIDETLTARIKQLIIDRDATLFMFILASYNVWLAKLSGQEDIIIGLPVSGRRHADLENTIGVLLDTVVLRNFPRGDRTFTEFLESVSEDSLKAFENQDFQFEMLLDKLGIPRDPGRNPIFDTAIDFLNMYVADDNGATGIKGLKMTPYKFAERTTTFDIILYVREEEDARAGARRIAINCYYRAGLFKKSTIQYFMGEYQRLLEQIAANPARCLKDYDIFNRKTLPPKSHQLRPEIPYTEFPAAACSQTLVSRFEEQVRRYPCEIAVKTATTTFTYETLNQKANQIANTILQDARSSFSETAREQAGVALLFEHNAEMIAGIFGVLKTGKIYVPLDPTYPLERLRIILNDCDAQFIVTNNNNLNLARQLTQQGCKIINIDELSNGISDKNPALHIPPEQIAVILYTSGSTGKPKGVMHSHFTIMNFICRYINELHIGHGDRMALFTSYTHAVAVIDIFSSLLNGAAVYPYFIKKEGVFGKLADWLRGEGITIYHSVPVLYRYFIDTLKENEILPEIRMVILGGEAVSKKDAELYKRHFSDHCILVNFFGASEVMVASFYYINRQSEIAHSQIPIGFMVEGVTASIINESGAEARVYEIGEIVYRSKFLALGYWNQSDKTRETFGQDSLTGERIYRGGDLGRLMPDGWIEYLGRKDFQVKIRGYRVELSEIETIMGSLPGIKNCAVILASKDNENYLAGYYELKEGSGLTGKEIRQALEEKLPEYMIPAYLEPLAEMPLTPNGKIDRQRLGLPSHQSSTEYVAPRNEIEEKLAVIWQEVLGVPKVSVTENFFEIGGNSLKALQMLALLPNYNLELIELLGSPTIAELGRQVKVIGTAGASIQKEPQYASAPDDKSNPLLQIKPSHEAWRNCHEDSVITLLSWLGLEHELIYTWSWNFKFSGNADATQSLGQRFSYSWDDERLLLEKYYGMVLTLSPETSPDGILKVIKKELAEGRPAFLGVDSFWNPWDLWYQSRHSDHAMLVVGMNEAAGELYCTDAYYSKQNVILPHDNFMKGARLCFTYAFKEKEQKISPTWREIISPAVMQARNPDKENMFAAIRNFAGIIETSFDVPKEAEESTNFWEIPFFVGFRETAYGRYKFAQLLEFLGAKYQLKALIKLADNFKLMGVKWDEIRSMIFKAMVSNTIISLDKVGAKIRELADYEASTAVMLTDIFERTDKMATGFDAAEEAAAALEVREIVYVDLSNYYNNNGFHNQITPDCAADISGNGFYFLWEDQYQEDTWQIEGMKFSFPQPVGGRNDNLVCDGQTITIPPGNYISIMFLGNSEWGKFSGAMTLYYANGKREEVVIEFSDWNLAPTEGEAVAWQGKAFEKREGEARICNFSPRIFAKKYQLNSREVLEKVQLPANLCMHVYAISLGKS